MIEKLTISSFHPHTEGRFEVRTMSGETIDLTLVEIADTSTDMIEGFHLIFRGPSDRVLSHDTHKVRNPKIGEFDLFLGPVVYGKTDGVYYQAVFSRLRPKAIALMKKKGTTANKAAATLKKAPKTAAKKSTAVRI